MLVDDDDLVRDLVAETLRVLGCDIVLELEDGREAGFQYAAAKPDLVLLDIKMTGVDGLEALRQILRRDPEACVVMLTSMDETVVAETCLRAGARDYLRKDSGLESLRRKLEALIAEISPS